MSWAVTAIVASVVIQQYNQSQTAKKQNKAAMAGLAEQRKFQEQANARANQELDKLSKSTPDDEYDTRSSQIREQLRRKNQMAMAGLQATGGGDAVTSMVNAAKPTATAYGDTINKYLSGIDAPLLQRQGEAFSRADMNSFINVMRRNSAQEAALTNAKIASIRDNPWLSMISKGLGAWGSSGLMSGGSTAGSSTGFTNALPASYNYSSTAGASLYPGSWMNVPPQGYGIFNSGIPG